MVSGTCEQHVHEWSSLQVDWLRVAHDLANQRHGGTRDARDA